MTRATPQPRNLREILRVTNIISAVCILAGLCVLALFGYLFVYRQRDVSVTMFLLGTGKKRVCAYFLFGSGVLSLVSAALGAFLGYLLSGRVGALITRLAASVTLSDMRYSNAALSITESLAFSPSASPGPFLFAAVSVFLLAVFSCLLFTLGTFRRKRARAGGAAAPEKAVRRFALRGKSAKYTLLSIARGGPRSVITPVTALLAALLLCRLAASGAAYWAEYENVCADTVIEGSVTDIYGETTGNLAVSGITLNTLLRSGYIGDMTISKSAVYYFEGIAVSGGAAQDIPAFVFPTGFAHETFVDHLLKGSSVVFTNSLDKSPEFYYSSFVETEFLDGYDLSVFTSGTDSESPVPCLLSTSFIAENGIEFGDTIRILAYNSSRFAELDLLVVGSYLKAGVKDNIYCPLSGYIDQDLLTVDESDSTYQTLSRITVDSADFTLADASKLSDFKDFLEACGYSGVNDLNAKRVFVLLDDRSFNDTVETLSRQIRYAGVLYPILYVLTGAAGLLGAYLLVLSRRREFAVMRVLGTPPAKAFGCFFFEQVLLCLPGAALGLAVSALDGSFSQRGALLTAGFAVCWLLGSAASLVRMDGPAVLAILHEEE